MTETLKFIFTEDFLDFYDITTAPDRLSEFQVKGKMTPQPQMKIKENQTNNKNKWVLILNI